MKPKFDNSKKLNKVTQLSGAMAQLEELSAGNWEFRKGNGKKGKHRTTDQFYRAVSVEGQEYPTAGERMLRFSDGEYPAAGKPEDFQKVVNIPGSMDKPLEEGQEVSMQEVYDYQRRRAEMSWFRVSDRLNKVWVERGQKGGGINIWPATGGAWCDTDNDGVPVPRTPTTKGGNQ